MKLLKSFAFLNLQLQWNFSKRNCSYPLEEVSWNHQHINSLPSSRVRTNDDVSDRFVAFNYFVCLPASVSHNPLSLMVIKTTTERADCVELFLDTNLVSFRKTLKLIGSLSCNQWSFVRCYRTKFDSYFRGQFAELNFKLWDYIFKISTLLSSLSIYILRSTNEINYQKQKLRGGATNRNLSPRQVGEDSLYLGLFESLLHASHTWKVLRKVWSSWINIRGNF